MYLLLMAEYAGHLISENHPQSLLNQVYIYLVHGLLY